MHASHFPLCFVYSFICVYLGCGLCLAGGVQAGIVNVV